MKNKDKYDLERLVIENILNIDNEILGYRVVDGVTGEIIFEGYNPELMFFNYHLLHWLESESENAD